MTTLTNPFTFLVSLAAVINGLGIVRLLTSFSGYLRRRHALEVKHYWVFSLYVFLQLLVHILLWWSLWGMRDVPAFNFLLYLYLLCGPTLLYMATSLLVPEIENEAVDLQEEYFGIFRPFFTTMSLVWLWALLISPLARGTLAPTAPVLGLFLLLALVSRFTSNPRAHGTLVVAHWALLLIFVGQFAMELGGVAVQAG
jgi:hypothetical protein